MESWEEMMSKGTKGPGSSMEQDKAAKKIHEARTKEDPSKVPYHPGVKGISIDEKGRLDIQSFNENERKMNPMVGDGSILMKNPEVKEFMEQAQKDRKSEETKKEETKSKPLEEEKGQDFSEDSYEERLEKAGISREQALEILDSLFSDQGYYEEEYSFGPIKFKLRTCRGEPVSYMLARLNQFKQWDVMSKSYTDEYAYHKQVYRLSLLLYSFGSNIFVDDKGRKTGNMIENTRDFILRLPDPIMRRMSEYMMDFEAKIYLVTLSGFENFF